MGTFSRAGRADAASCGVLDLAAGRRVVLRSLLGRGTETSVYLGELETWGSKRSVAVKLFDGVHPDDRADIARRLEDASQRAACIVHPNVLGTFDFGSPPNGAPFLVSELVHGIPLSRRVGRAGAAPLPIDLALGVALAVTESLAAAWLAPGPDGVALELAHGALSARDVYLTRAGEVKVADFGIVTRAWRNSAVRSIESMSPRLATLAPEVARGAVPDARSDVFAAGVILHEMLLGARFAGVRTVGEAMTMVHDGVVPENAVAPGAASIARPLRALIRCAIAADPAARFPHARAFSTALTRVARSFGIREDAALVAACARGEI